MRLQLIFYLLVGFLSFPMNLQISQSRAEISSISVNYSFEETASFHAIFSPDTIFRQLILNIQARGNVDRSLPVTEITNNEAIYTLDLHQIVFRPFSQVTYWFSGKTTDGSEVISKSQTFMYEDNRFPWQTIEDPPFEIHWYEGNDEFGVTAAVAAREGLKGMQNFVDIAPDSMIRIYIYADPMDLQSALPAEQQSWIGGNSSPDLKLVLVSIAPGADLQSEMARQIPHEIMHVLQYQVLGEQIDHLPMWLAEGLATKAEIVHNTDYQNALDQAVASDNLLPFNTICDAFPREASGAFLAYAQSASFVQFLQEKYGRDTLSLLILNYRNTSTCSKGLETTLHENLDHVEIQWKEQALGINPIQSAIKELAPYSLLLLLISLPVIGLGIRSTTHSSRSHKG